MARISDEELERLKREVSLERLVVARGVKLKRQGKDLLGGCPFHEDKTPSLVVSPEKNLWHCLGACQAGGSVIDWVMKSDGVSFRHAVELLRGEPASLAADVRRSRGPQEGAVPKRSLVRKLAGDFDPRESDSMLLSRVVDYYQQALEESPEALAYLESRGLGSQEMREHFRIGFSNRTLGYRLPIKGCRAGAELRGRLQALGVMRESGHEHMSGSIVVPLFDELGNVVQMYGRKISSHLRAGTPLHLYLPGPQRGIFNRQAFDAAGHIILCESIFDALTIWCTGWRNVTTCYGAGGFTEELREAFARTRPDAVLIAFDRDKAGDAGAQKVGAELAAMGMEVKRVLFPHGMDANEYALAVTPARESVTAALRGAVWLAGKACVAAAAPGAAPEEAAKGEMNEGQESAFAAPAAEAPPSLAAFSDPPVAPAPTCAVYDARADEAKLVLGDRLWRLRGLMRNSSPGTLRINVLVSRERGGFHVDTLELYSARQRALFVKMAADELGAEEEQLKKELGVVLLELERLQHELFGGQAAPKAEAPALSEAEREAAHALLRAPDLIERLTSDFERLGVVGERDNKLVLYLASVSRKLDEPLAVVIQSSSAAGKSALMEAVLSLVPQEERVQYSAMTGQSLFYMGEQDLRHKVLAIVEEEGAERASYALKLLQSEGELTIASTGKDPHTGRMVTQEYRVEGPVMIMLTTTAVDVDEELLNRCLVLTVDEGREQTRAIHARQRRAQTLAGLVERREREALVKLHQNAQRLLVPLAVVNPFAEKLCFVDHQPRTRRDHMKYLTLIRTIALLHQQQREVKELEHRGERLRYIEVTERDIELGNRLCHQVLGRSLDELAPQTRRLLELLDAMVVKGCAEHGVVKRSDYFFSRREVREVTGWSQTQLRVHLGRLCEMEYLLVHRGRRGQSFVYELVWDGRGKDGAPFVSGLLEPSAEPTPIAYDGNLAGGESHLAGGWRRHGGAKAAPWRATRTNEIPHEPRVIHASAPANAPVAPLVPPSSGRVVAMQARAGAER